MGASDVLYDKVVALFTDEPEQFAPDQVLHRDLGSGLQVGRGDDRPAGV